MVSESVQEGTVQCFNRKCNGLYTVSSIYYYISSIYFIFLLTIFLYLIVIIYIYIYIKVKVN